MVSKRASLALLLCAVLLATTSFAATKKSKGRRNRSGGWSDLSRNGDLPNAGSSVSRARHGNSSLSQDPIGAFWLGGGGNWTNISAWDCDGVHCIPSGDNYDVNIGVDSGQGPVNGSVLLDLSPTIHSLTLGNGAQGTLTIANSYSLTVTDGVFVGYSGPGGTGTLNIRSGGTLVNQSDGYVSALAGSVGNVNISGSGSQWNNSGTLYIGDYGQGTLTISSGGVVTSNTTYLGFQSGSSGNVSVSGVGSQ